MRQLWQTGPPRRELQIGESLEVSVDVWVPEVFGQPLPPRRRHLSPIEQGQLAQQRDKWLGAGVIELVPNGLPWTNNTVHVAKANGTIRVCIDCTPANLVTKDFDWPLPRLQDLRHFTRPFIWFSRMDLKDAFFRISVPVLWRPLTAFHCGGQDYQFLRMPFGLKTAPSVFQRFMDHTLAAHKGRAFWYLDDVLVGGRTLAELRHNQRLVKASLIAAGNTINEDKSEYEVTGLLFAGLWVYSRGVGPNHSKVEQARRLPIPRTKKEKQSALGLISYLRDHLPLASHLTACLTTGRQQPPTPEYEEMWSELQRSLAQSLTTLQDWDEKEDADLYTDGSKVGCAAVLFQNGRIVAVVSRKFTPAETRYSTTDREHLGLVLAAKKLKLFLHRDKGETRLWSDHTSLLSRKDDQLQPRQARWRTLVNAWMPNIRHVKGLENPADYFSRWPINDLGAEIRV